MDDIMAMINYIDGSASKNNGGWLMGEDLRGIALSMLRPVFTSISTKKGTLIIIQVQRQLEISFDISDEFDFID